MSDIKKITNLNDSFAIEGAVRFEAGAGDLPVARISNELCEATISVYGAHILSYIPKGFDDLLWVSKKSIYKEGTPIRGGVPVCWPWFGPHPTDDEVMSHGFARRNSWEVTGTHVTPDGETVVEFQLNSIVQDGWPNPCNAKLVVTAGSTMRISLATENISKETVVVSNALHTYFDIGNIEKVSVSGLDKCEYVDSIDDDKEKDQQGDITFDGEVDRIYRDTEAQCIIDDRENGRLIKIAKEGSRATVVWNPWQEKAGEMADFGNDEYLGMLCVETVNTLDDSRTLSPGQSHSVVQIISVENS